MPPHARRVGHQVVSARGGGSGPNARRHWSASRRWRWGCRTAWPARRGLRGRRRPAAPRSRPRLNDSRVRRMRCAVGRSHCWFASTISGTASPRCSRTAATRRRSSAAVWLAHLELDAANAALDRRRGVHLQLVQRGVQEAARGVVAAHGVAVGAEQLGQREAGALCLQVPERHVDGADGLRGQPAASHRGAGPAELVPEPGDVAGVLAQQGRGDLARVGVLARAAGPLRIAEAEPGVAIGGADFGEQDGHLGHRLLPAGQHLGVADRGGEAGGSRRRGESRRSNRETCGFLFRYDNVVIQGRNALLSCVASATWLISTAILRASSGNRR